MLGLNIENAKMTNKRGSAEKDDWYRRVADKADDLCGMHDAKNLVIPTKSHSRKSRTVILSNQPLRGAP